ncbi:MAG: ASCH domain-containing protein [Burkholderiales bacterium]|nr:MAG: ASCH domain-containing protein [Burkholderiales bacterium]
MPVPTHLAPFWSAFTASVAGVDEGRFYEAFSFGDSQAMADELADLVLRGVKRATTSALWTFEEHRKPLPEPGDLSLVTRGSGEPVCVIRTASVEVLPFRSVTAEFAAAEGEGDGSLSFWQAAHRDYFQRECARGGREFSDDMPVVCEHFTVVYPRAAAG